MVIAENSSTGFADVPLSGFARNWAAFSGRSADFRERLSLPMGIRLVATIGFRRANTITQLCDKPNMMLFSPDLNTVGDCAPISSARAETRRRHPTQRRPDIFRPPVQNTLFATSARWARFSHASKIARIRQRDCVCGRPAAAVCHEKSSRDDYTLFGVGIKNQAALFKRLKRSIRKGAGSTQGVEPVTRSAIRAPAPGPIPKPWPEKPVAR